MRRKKPGRCFPDRTNFLFFNSHKPQDFTHLKTGKNKKPENSGFLFLLSAQVCGTCDIHFTCFQAPACVYIDEYCGNNCADGQRQCE